MSAKRVQKKLEARAVPSRASVTRAVLSRLEDAYGGEGWDDEALIPIVEEWITWPISWPRDPVDGEPVDIEAETASLLDQSFDPRDILAMYRRR